MIINIDGIDIEVQRKKMKNMTIRVCPPHGMVKMSAPLRASIKSIYLFASMQIAWIQKHKSAYQANIPDQTQIYAEGEKHFLQGREYLLRIHEGKRSSNSHDDTHIDLFVLNNASLEHREKALMKFYRQKLLSELTTLVPHWENIVGVKALKYQIRLMKSRWGTCHPKKRNITLNLALIKYPTACLEYVIVHELVHLIEASHNHRFKSLMDKFMPDWQAIKKQLDHPYETGITEKGQP